MPSTVIMLSVSIIRLSYYLTTILLFATALRCSNVGPSLRSIVPNYLNEDHFVERVMSDSSGAVLSVGLN